MDSRIQQIFREHFGEFSAGRKLPLQVHKAAGAIQSCRTEALGGHVQACPAGHVKRVWYNSCRHRFCPLCAFIHISEWIGRQRARLIGCEYHHTIFTLAEELNPLWEHNRQRFTNLLFRGRKRWNVRIQPPYRHGEGVLEYLGHYVRGGPISDHRIRRLGEHSVRVRYQNPERTKYLYMVLSVQEFLSRLVRHVPPAGVHHVRHYGLFAHTHAKELNQARALLGQLPVEDLQERCWQEVCAEAGAEHPERCPVCGRVLIRMELPPTTRAPPRRCAA